jgi:hypothetical protein
MKITTKIQLYFDVIDDIVSGNKVTGLLDVKEGSDFPINFSISDIRDISKRNGNWTKTIQLPGTKNNNDLLNNYFEVNMSSGAFNLNKKQRCAVIQNGVVILDHCYFRLNKVNKVQSQGFQVDDLVEYEAELRNGIGDFFNEINNKNLDDLTGFEIFSHTFSTAEIESSLDHTWVNGYKYVFPWIDNNNWNINMLLPGIYAKQYFDKIHYQAGYDYEWSSLTASNIQFDKMLMPYSGDKKKLSDDFIKDNEVIANRLTVQNNTFTSALGNFGTVQGTLVPEQLVQVDNEIKDNNNYWNPATSIYSNAFNFFNPNFLNWQVEIDWELEFVNNNAFNIVVYANNSFFIPSNPNAVLKFRPELIIRNQFPSIQNPTGTPKGFSKLEFNNTTAPFIINSDGDAEINGQSILINTGATRNIGSGQNVLNIPTSQLNIGYDLRLLSRVWWSNVINPNYKVFNQSTGAQSTIQVRLKINSIRLRIAPSADIYVLPGEQINIQRFIPKGIKQSDFLKSIYQKYNLYPEIDLSDKNKIIYKTRDDYYDSGEFKDWTSKIAKDVPQDLLFIPDISSKKVVLSYKDDDNDYALKAYKEETSETYGQVEVIFENENVRGIDRKDLIFSPTINIPGYALPNTNLPLLNLDFKYNLRILYDGGKRPIGTPATITEFEDTGVFNITHYPYLSMLDEPTNPNFDIAFGINDYYPYDIINFTANNLYTNHWRRTLAQMNAGKMLIASFYLNELDIANLKLNDKIKIGNTLWYINAVKDYRANKKQLTRVELLSVEDDLRLPRFGRIIKPVLPGAYTAPETLPSLPGGIIFPIAEAINQNIKTRSVNSTVGAIGSYEVIGYDNIISNGFKGFVVANRQTVDESGYWIENTKLTNGQLSINDVVDINSGGIFYNLGGINSTPAAITFGYDPFLDQTILDLTANNVNIQQSVTTISVNYLISNENIILCNQSASINVTLPTPSNGKQIIIKDISGNAKNNFINIIGTIDGQTNYRIQIDYEAIKLVSNGTAWFII